MMKNIVVKKSGISGKGIFALRDFKKGEIVLKWNPKFIRKDKIRRLPNKNIQYVSKIGKKFVLMQSPEKYVNHSCESNTKMIGGCDVAKRNIKKNEEITTDYSGCFLLEGFKCGCASKKCRQFIS
jgi:SET domain-containing protein